jgi:DNA topoisomerase-2
MIEIINKELIHFSFSDNVRSIPNVIDGLKPSQRKVLFGCFLKFPHSISSNAQHMKEIKVMQLAGYIAEKTAYHHGEQSLHSTIVNMAQSFIGSNNVPFLEGIGQFGTRYKGGADYASPRYIYTKLSPITRYIFPVEDDMLLDYQEEDGQRIEPKFYVPIVPTVLLNGCKGIGTGWSTSIPSYHLLDVIDLLERRINRDNQANDSKEVASSKLMPYFNGFKGRIYADTDIKGDQSTDRYIGVNYISEGNIQIVGKNTIEITELPVEKWTEDYKEYLLKLVEDNEIKSFQEYHTIHSIRFVINLPNNHKLFDFKELQAAFDGSASAAKSTSANKSSRSKSKKAEANTSSVTVESVIEKSKWKLVQFFRLQTNLLTGNMYAFDRDNKKIQKYSSAEDIIDEFYPVRRHYYCLRKLLLEKNLHQDYLVLDNKARFIRTLLTNDSSSSFSKDDGETVLSLSNLHKIRNKEDLRRLLQDTGFLSMTDINQRSNLILKDHPDVLSKIKSHELSTSLSEEPEIAEDNNGIVEVASDSGGGKTENRNVISDFDYLLRLSIDHFTFEKSEALEKRANELQREYQGLKAVSATDLWKRDLQRLRETYLQMKKEETFD